MLLSVIMPTKGRGEQAVRCVQRLFETTQGFDLELFIVAHPEEETKKAFLKLPSNKKINVEYVDIRPMPAYNLVVPQTKGTHLFGMDDDAWFGDDWLAKVMKKFDEIPGQMGYVKILSDSQNYWAERAVGTRNFYTELLGGIFAIPHYISQFEDVEKSDRAIAANIFHVSDAYIEHRHPAYGKAEVDETYKDGYLRHCSADEATYSMRKAIGFPNDYERVF